MSNTDEGVIRVHEQGHVVRLSVGVCVEGGLLVAEDLDPGVGVSAAHGYAEEPPGEDVGSGGNAADVCRSGCGECPVRTLGAAHPELENRVVAGCLDDAGGLRGHERLEPHYRQ